MRHSISIFRGCVCNSCRTFQPLKTRTLHCLKTLQSKYLVMQLHIPEEWNQLRCSQNPKSSNTFFVCKIWVSYSCVSEDSCLLADDAALLDEHFLTFLWNVASSSRSSRSPRSLLDPRKMRHCISSNIKDHSFNEPESWMRIYCITAVLHVLEVWFMQHLIKSRQIFNAKRREFKRNKLI